MAYLHLHFLVLCSTVDFLHFLKQQIQTCEFANIAVWKVIEVEVGGRL